jgi:hypothetical protein
MSSNTSKTLARRLMRQLKMFVKSNPGNRDMNEEETLATLWEIAQEVATKDNLSEHAFGGYEYCMLCSGHEYRMLPFKHEPSCIVLKSRALVEKRKTATLEPELKEIRWWRYNNSAE